MPRPSDPLREYDDDEKGLAREQVMSIRGIPRGEEHCATTLPEKIDFRLEELGMPIGAIMHSHPEWFASITERPEMLGWMSPDYQDAAEGFHEHYDPPPDFPFPQP